MEKERPEKIFKEITAQNFTNTVKTINTQTQHQQTSGMRNTEGVTPRHIIIKLLVTGGEEETVKSTRGRKDVA